MMNRKIAENLSTPIGNMNVWISTRRKSGIPQGRLIALREYLRQWAIDWSRAESDARILFVAQKRAETERIKKERALKKKREGEGKAKNVIPIRPPALFDEPIQKPKRVMSLKET